MRFRRSRGRVLPHAAIEALPTPLIKGSHLMQAEAFIDERLGSGAFRSMATGPGPTTGLVLPGSWYDAHSFVQVLGLAAERLELPFEELTRQVARRNALDDLTSIYRVFLRLAAPHLTLALTPRMWFLYTRFGEPRLLRNDPGEFVGEVHQLPPGLFDWACGALLGFIPAAVEVAGGRYTDAHISERWRSGATSALRFEMRYES